MLHDVTPRYVALYDVAATLPRRYRDVKKLIVDPKNNYVHTYTVRYLLIQDLADLTHALVLRILSYVGELFTCLYAHRS